MSYFKAKCTKFVFGWASAPDPAGGAYSAPQTPSWISGVSFQAEGGEGEGEGE